MRLGVISLVSLLCVLTGAAPAQASPRDEQWYLDQIEAPAAQEITRGGGVTIGMVVDALDSDFPDLVGRVAPEVRLDNYGNTHEGSSHEDILGYDTGMAVFAVGNGTGLLGVAPEATLQPVNPTFWGEGDVSLAVQWLVDTGVRIVVVPESLSDETHLDADTVRYALSKGCLIILPAELADVVTFDSTGVLVVGGIDREGERHSLVDLTSVDLVAPASEYDMISPDTSTGGYQTIFFKPDRAAAALVAGVAALVWSEYPDLNAASVINRLLATATDIGDAGVDDEYGYGEVNALAAVTEDVAEVSVNPLGDPGPPSADFDTSYDYDKLTPTEWLMIGAASSVGFLTVVGLAGWLYRRKHPIGPVRFGQ